MSQSLNLKLVQKQVPEIGKLSREDAQAAVDAAWRAAFLEHRVAGTFMIPGMMLLGALIVVGIVAVFDVVPMPWPPFIPHALRFGIGMLIGLLVEMSVTALVYERWRTSLIAAKLRA